MNTSVIISIAFVGLIFFFFIRAYRKMKNQPVAVDNEKIVHLNNQNFNQITKSGISLIDFWAEWCMPCKMMAPVLNEVANEAEGNVHICKVNVESEQNLASKFGVRSIPTLVLLKNGQEIARFVGVKQKNYLLEQINKNK
jgi:thioredoxin 1